MKPSISSTALENSLLHRIFFPKIEEEVVQRGPLLLKRPLYFRPKNQTPLGDLPMVFFDLETTGLNPQRDEIIEWGALRVENGKVVKTFETLIACPRPLSPLTTKICGIDDSMLVGKPSIKEVLGDFLKFMQGAILVAHNAPFDYGFLTAKGRLHGFEIHWPVFCSLKLARKYLTQLPRKDLGSLAKHFDIVFEARHRSMGDVKATWEVWQKIEAEHGPWSTISDLEPFGL